MFAGTCAFPQIISTTLPSALQWNNLINCNTKRLAHFPAQLKKTTPDRMKAFSNVQSSFLPVRERKWGCGLCPREQPGSAAAADAGQCCHHLFVCSFSCHYTFSKCISSNAFILQYTSRRGGSEVERTVSWQFIWTGRTLHFLVSCAGRKRKDTPTERSEKTRAACLNSDG